MPYTTPQIVGMRQASLQAMNHFDEVSIEAVDARLAARASQTEYESAGGVALINISGPMEKYASIWTALFGGAVHTEIERAVKAATADPNVSTILLRIDSPGGDVAGVSDLANAVARASETKHVVAYCSDMAASCGYYVASQADEIYADDDALIGCIGTMLVLYDYSEMFESEGVATHLFATGPVKGAGAMGVKLTEEHAKMFQKEVDDLGELFVEAVAKGRKMSLEQVRKLATGECFVSAEAVSNGLIDGIKDWDTLVAELQITDQPAGGNSSRMTLASMELRLAELE